MKKLSIFLCAMLLTFAVLGIANAVPIDLASFSGTETLIDFSVPFERSPSPLLYQGVLFTGMNNVFSSDLAANVNWGFFFNNIPGASGGYALNDFVSRTELRIQFSTNVNRVGLLLSTGEIRSWSMIAWDDNGTFIEATGGAMPGNTEAFFLGLETETNIAYIDIMQWSDDGLVTLFDDLRFESTAQISIPDASIMLLLGSSLIVLVGIGRRTKKKEKYFQTL